MVLLGDLERLAAELDAPFELTAVHAEQPSEQVEDPAPQDHVVAGLAEGAEEELLAPIDVEIDPLRDRLDAGRTRLVAIEEFVDHRRRGRRLTGGGAVGDARERASGRTRRVATRRDPQAVAGQLGGNRGGAAPGGAFGGRFQLGGDCVVRLAAGEGEVAGAGVAVGDDRGEAGMQRRALERIGAVEYDRGQQRVGEADDAVLAGHEQPVVDGGGDQPRRVRVVTRAGQVRRRRRTEGGRGAEDGEEIAGQRRRGGPRAPRATSVERRCRAEPRSDSADRASSIAYSGLPPESS